MAESQAFSDLSGLFRDMGVEYQVFDMGRRVSPVDRQTWQDFEAGKAAWPAPLDRKAWLAFLLWHRDIPETQGVWFLHFPLDENAHLNPAILSDMLRQLNHDIDRPQDGQDQTDQLPEGHCSYAYRPRQEHLASFHAQAAVRLRQPASSFFAPAVDYLQSPDTDSWQSLGLQGLADISARLSEGKLLDIVVGSIADLPVDLLILLCFSLEHVEVPQALASVIIKRAQAEDLLPLTVAAVRAVSACPVTGTRQSYIRSVLNGPDAGKPEILAAIAAKGWLMLEDAETAALYLEALAQADTEENIFGVILQDLLFIQSIRSCLMDVIRNENRSEKLAASVGQFFSQVRSGNS